MPSRVTLVHRPVDLDCDGYTIEAEVRAVAGVWEWSLALHSPLGTSPIGKHGTAGTLGEALQHANCEARSVREPSECH